MHILQPQAHLHPMLWSVYRSVWHYSMKAIKRKCFLPIATGRNISKIKPQKHMPLKNKKRPWHVPGLLFIVSLKAASNQHIKSKAWTFFRHLSVTASIKILTSQAQQYTAATPGLGKQSKRIRCPRPSEETV